MKLQSEQIIGFGISNKETFEQATKYAKGAIIGSAYVNFLSEQPWEETDNFIRRFR